MYINWKELLVGSGTEENTPTLGHLIESNDPSVLNIKLKDGWIDVWPQLFVFAPGEDANWDTPVVPVDWTGFEGALTQACKNISTE